MTLARRLERTIIRPGNWITYKTNAICNRQELENREWHIDGLPVVESVQNTIRDQL